MRNIFISYSSEDRDWARRLAQALEQEGWSVRWARKIAVGKSYFNNRTPDVFAGIKKIEFAYILEDKNESRR